MDQDKTAGVPESGSNGNGKGASTTASAEFVSKVAHDLRTPLNAILGWSQILKRKATDPDLVSGLEVIERNARTMAEMIQNISDTARGKTPNS